MRLALILSLAAIASAAHAQIDEAQLKGMRYRCVGPYRGGRVLTVTGVPNAPSTFYFGAVAGGVWKTTDAGVTWTPLFQNEETSSIGSIAVAQSDPNILYVGTGEGCLRGDITYGNGVYKSLDGGKSWKNVGLKDTRQIGRLIIHPRDPNIVFVAAIGHAFGPNQERGVFRTLDGGKVWSKVLFVNDQTGAIDVQMDPTNPNVLFAAMYQVERQPWMLTTAAKAADFTSRRIPAPPGKGLKSTAFRKGCTDVSALRSPPTTLSAYTPR
jgi:hypothetical protein